MSSAAHHVALVVAIGLVADAARRVAVRLGACGVLETAVAAAPIGAAIAGSGSLALGLAALGGSPVLLFLGALFTWLAARSWPGGDGAYARLTWDGRGALLLGAGLGAAAAWVAWLVKHPALAIDPLTYHLPESIEWVQQGTPGSVEEFQYDYPQGNYPVTNELLVSWLLGIGRSLSPALFWTPAMGALLAAAGWLGLRRLGAPKAAAGLAVAGVLLVPVAATQFLGPHTDLPAFAWLVVTAALGATAAAGRRPALLAPAVIAAGLAIGTKTTAGPLTVISLGAAVWALRRELRPAARALALAAAAAIVVGGTWYIRNLIDHGSPFWPFIATSWGDPVPPALQAFNGSFLDRPAESLEGRTGTYVDLLAGGLILLAAALVAPLLARRRLVTGVAAATVVAALAWVTAPYTGVADDPVVDLSLTTTRYLVPAIVAAAAAVALADGRAGIAILAVAALLSLERALALPFPAIPSLPWLLAGAAAGAIALRTALPRLRRTRPAVVLGGAGLLAAAALTVANHDFAARQGGITRYASSGVVSWMAANPAWRDDDEPIAFAPQILAVLAGEDLRHDIELLPRAASCAHVRARLAQGWVVIGDFPFAERRAAFTADDCLRDERPVYEDALYRVYFRAPASSTATRRPGAPGSGRPSTAS